MKTLDGHDVGADEGDGATLTDAAAILYGPDPESESSADEGDGTTLTADSEENEKSGGEQTRGEDRVPEGSYDIKLPEGVIVNDAQRAEFESLAKEHGLKNGAAQKLADLHLKAVHEAFSEQQKTLEKRYDEVQGWRKELRNDPVMGRAQLGRTIADAKWVLEQMGAPNELKQFKTQLDMTGLGEHPFLIRGLAKLAARLKVPAKQNESALDAATILYGPTGVRKHAK